MDKKLIFFAVFLIVLSLGLIWSVDYVPLQDYPQHLLRPVILKNINNADFDFGENFRINFMFPPYLLTDLIILGLNYFFPILIAGNIMLSLYLILFPLSVFYFINAVRKENIFLGFSAFILTFNFYYASGFVSYCLSLAFVFFALGFWFKHGIDSKRNLIVFSLLTILAYFTHLLSMPILFLPVIIDIIKNKKFDKIARLFIATLPVFVLLVSLALNAISTSEAQIRPVYYPLADTLFLLAQSMIFFAEGLSLSLKSSGGFIAIVIILLFLISIFNDLKNKQISLFSSIVFAFIILFFITPFKFIYENTYVLWSYLNVRMMLPLLVFLIPAINLKFNEKTKSIICLMIIGISFFSIASLYNEYALYDQEVKDYISGIYVIEKGSTILPMHLAEIKTVEPALHYWAYYIIENGGLSPRFFTSDYMYLIVPQYERIARPSEYRPEEYDSEKHAEYYDYVITWGSNSNVFDEIEKDFKLKYSNNKLRVYEKI